MAILKERREYTMSNLNLRELNSIANNKYSIENMNVNFNQDKELYISNYIIKEILNSYEENKYSLENYYNLINNKVAALEKKLIVTINNEKPDFSAQVIGDYKNKIEIIFYDNNRTYEEKIFPHELGEVEFLTEKYPRIIDCEGRQIDIGSLQSVLLEIFSHRYIDKTLKVNYLEGYIRKEKTIGEVNRKLELGNINKSNYETILSIVHVLSTYEHLYSQRYELVGYDSHSEEIENVLKILRSDSIFNSAETVRDACGKLIVILNEVGLKNLKIQDNILNIN